MIIQKSIKLAMEVFEQKMEDFADKVTVKELTADLAMDFSATLKDAFSEAGRKAYQRLSNSMILMKRNWINGGYSVRRWSVPRSF